jgi:hypothetical protein
LALTANHRKAVLDASFATGCNDHLSRPISRQNLLAAIERFQPCALPAWRPMQPDWGRQHRVTCSPEGMNWSNCGISVSVMSSAPYGYRYVRQTDETTPD